MVGEMGIMINYKWKKVRLPNMIFLQTKRLLLGQNDFVEIIK
jgi:hypothetical protein